MIRIPALRALRAEGVRIPRTRVGQRLYSSNPESRSSQTTRTRAERITSRLPKFLQRYTTPLMKAPLTHISAFLILHELTAVVPLLGLAGIFHYTKWLPPYISEGKYVSDGVEKFGNYFRRKGWLGHDATKRYKWWGRGEGGVRVVVEFATAYAIMKVLLPLRLIISVSATPWFARFAVVPFTNRFRRLFRRKPPKPPSSGAAGTGATGGAAIPGQSGIE